MTWMGGPHLLSPLPGRCSSLRIGRAGADRSLYRPTSAQQLASSGLGRLPSRIVLRSRIRLRSPYQLDAHHDVRPFVGKRSRSWRRRERSRRIPHPSTARFRKHRRLATAAAAAPPSAPSSRPPAAHRPKKPHSHRNSPPERASAPPGAAARRPLPYARRLASAQLPALCR